MQTMKQLKVKLISPSNVLLFFTILFLCNCKEKSNSQKNEGENVNLPKEIPLTKEEFFKCSGAKDTVFANGDYLKFIPVKSDHYDMEINMKGTIDTLDYYLTCQTYSVPKLFFKLNSDYICIGTGSSSYRYLKVCSIRYQENSKKIDISEFETGRDVSSVNDGFIFKIRDTIYFYDLNKKVLRFKKLSTQYSVLKIKESSLYDNSVNIVFEHGDSLTYKLKDFQLYQVSQSTP